MIPEIKERWTAALRSDEYKRTHGALHTENGFCCLGVLCDLHRKAHPGYKWVWDEDYDGYVYSTAERYELPREVVDWAGLEYTNPLVGNHEFNGEVYQSLAELNDAGATFAEIADVIEENL